MHKALAGQKLAVLVANGFCEKDLTEMQRGLMKTGANVKIIGMEQGLVNSWNGAGWGLNFPADQTLSTALGADFDILVHLKGFLLTLALNLTDRVGLRLK